MTKRDMDLIKWNYAAFNAGRGYADIWATYDRPSTAKVNAWRSLAAWFKDNGGTCRVISANCQMFTVCGEIVNQETGEVFAVYVTRDHRRIAPAAEVMPMAKAA